MWKVGCVGVMKHQLFVIDPGETVGWAMFVVKDGELEVACHGQGDWEKFLWNFEDMLEKGYIDSILVEDYVVRTDTIGANIGSSLRTVRVMGVIEWLVAKAGLNQQLYWQPPGIGERFFNQKRLKEMGMWAGRMEHARSAIKHGLYFLMFGEGKEWITHSMNIPGEQQQP